MDLDPELIERMAEVAHDSWAGWYVWMRENWDAPHPKDGSFRARWDRQARTPYHLLSEREKESDRIEARKYLKILNERGALK